MLGRLIRAAEDNGASLTTNAHVVDVYADDKDRVLGVGIERPDGTRETLGCDALVLATCGFGAGCRGNQPAVHIFFLNEFPKCPKLHEVRIFVNQ